MLNPFNYVLSIARKLEAAAEAEQEQEEIANITVLPCAYYSIAGNHSIAH